MARQVLVRYKVKADRVVEHEALIRAVFAELVEASPSGIRYGAFKREDGLSFVHVAFIAAETNPLNTMASFKAFGERIKDRCDEPPEVVELKEIGAFGL